MEYERKESIPLIDRRTSLDYEAVAEYLKYKEQGDETIYLRKLQEWKYLYFQPITKGSVRASIFCLLCVSVGSGVLSLPYNIKVPGLILGMIIFLISSFATYWTLNLLKEAAYKDKIYSYGELVEKYYGKKLLITTEVILVINNMGSIVAWNMFSIDRYLF